VEIERSKKAVEKVFVRPELLDYIAQVVFQTRNHPGLFLGASPRASLAIMKTAKAVAAMDGRDFVTPDDVRSVSLPVLNHRVILTPEREMEGVRVDDVIGEILNRVEVPM
jgi:MoxR-like ATPase